MKKEGINTLFNIFYYYYFALAILNLIFVYFDLNTLYNITTVLILVSMGIELMLGYIRGCFGIFGYLISIVIFYFITNNIWLSISIGLSALHIIYIFINHIFFKFIHWLDRKLTKK